MFRARFLFALVIAVAILAALPLQGQGCGDPFTPTNLTIGWAGPGCYGSQPTGCGRGASIWFMSFSRGHMAALCDQYFWSFGDGTTASGGVFSEAFHAYAAAGKYTVRLTASNPVSIATYEATILVDNGRFDFNSNSPSYVLESSGKATVTVTRTSSYGTVSVQYATADGTAAAGVRYVATSGTLTFNADEAAKTIVIPLIQDTVSEGAQQFSVNLSNPSDGCTLMHSSATVIVDDDPAYISFAPVPVAYETAGAASVTVLRTGAVNRIATVVWHVDLTYGPWILPASGVVTFNPGDISKTFTVPLAQNNVYYGASTQERILLEPATGAGVTTPYTDITIIHEDPVPTISVADVSVAEGNSGETPVTCNIVLSAPLGWSHFVT